MSAVGPAGGFRRWCIGDRAGIGPAAVPDLYESMSLPRPLEPILLGLVWLLTSALGIAEVAIGVDLIMAAYAGLLRLFNVIVEEYGREYWVGFNVQTISAMLLGLIVISMSIVSGETYLRHHGTRRARRMAAVVVAVELVILLVGYFFSPDAFVILGWVAGSG